MRGDSPARGRRRDGDIHARILEAAKTLLVEVGYSRFSFEGVTRATGISRPTIYRRWPSKAHLVYEVLFPVVSGGIADTGDLEADVAAFVGSIADTFADPLFRVAFPGLLADFVRTPGLEEAVTEANWTRACGAFVARIESARAQGEVTGAPDPIDLLEAAVGALFHRLVILHKELGDYVEVLTDMILGMLDHARP